MCGSESLIHWPGNLCVRWESWHWVWVPSEKSNTVYFDGHHLVRTGFYRQNTELDYRFTQRDLPLDLREGLQCFWETSDCSTTSLLTYCVMTPSPYPLTLTSNNRNVVNNYNNVHFCTTLWRFFIVSDCYTDVKTYRLYINVKIMWMKKPM